MFANEFAKKAATGNYKKNERIKPDLEAEMELWNAFREERTVNKYSRKPLVLPIRAGKMYACGRKSCIL